MWVLIMQFVLNYGSYVIIGAAGFLIGGFIIGGWVRNRLRHQSDQLLAAAGSENSILFEKLQAQLSMVEWLNGQLEEQTHEIQRLQQRSEQLHAANAAFEAQVEEKQAQLKRSDTDQAQKQAQLATLQQEMSQQKARISELSTLLEQERKQAAEKIAMLNEARDQLKIEFQNLAQKIFEEKSSRFMDQNQKAVDQLIAPLREQIGDFKKRVEDVYDKETRDRSALHAEIVHLKDLNQRISKEALNLTRALKGDSKARGNWGEVILERVLESSGLQKGREYEVQVSLRDQANKRYQPDAVVRLPEGKDVIVDAKVSLKDYEAFYSAEVPEDKEKYLSAHIESLRHHIRDLAAKKYEALEGVRTLDFTLMFVPIEAAFLAAVERDGALFSEAFEKNIIVVSPSTLLVTLRTIQNIWRNEYQNRNAIEIAKKAGALYDKFVGFAQALDEVGRQLDKARDAYLSAHGRLISGRGNLVRRTQELKDLGVKAGKELPVKMLEAVKE
jgi:DNA recombination protein RmuC